MSTLSDDLTAVRRLAESGANAPLLGGRYLAWWGVVVTVAYALHYGLMAGHLPGGPASLPILWSIATGSGIAGQCFIGWQTRARRPGAASAANQAQIAVWTGASAVIAAIIGAAIAKSVIEQGVGTNFSGTLPGVFAVYATAQLTIAVLSRSALCAAAGFAALIALVATYVLAAQPEAYLAASLGAALAVLVPGAIQLLREPAPSFD